jgi:hypothetical protein
MKTAHQLTVTIFGLAIFNLSAATLYVSLHSMNPMAPYATWATAATNIQHAVDVAKTGDTVLVTNGVYATGGRVLGTNRLANRVVVEKQVTVQSVRGPQLTVIEGAKAPGGGNGDGAVRCAYLSGERSCRDLR